MDVIKVADYIVDVGPDGGVAGGEVVFSGTPEQLVKLKNNYTAQYLREEMEAYRRGAKERNDKQMSEK